MKWPQIVVIVLLAMETGLSLAKHGEKRDGKYNFLLSLVCNLIWATILYYGGFWG